MKTHNKLSQMPRPGHGRMTRLLMTLLAPMRSLLTIRGVWALSRYPRKKPSRSTQITAKKRDRAYWQRITKSTGSSAPKANPK